MNVLWLVLAVVAAIGVTMWLTFTATRLDRLHARVDAAQAALDAQLVRRAAALARAVEQPGSLPAPSRREFDQLARRALEPGHDAEARRSIENQVGRAVRTVLDPAAPGAPADAGSEAEIREAAARVLIARRFYNDAVRDTRALRSRRLPRMFRMAGRRVMPEFFDIDDTLPPSPEKDH